MSRKKQVEDKATPVMDDIVLTDAELRFVDEYLIDRDPFAATIRSGIARIAAKKKMATWMGDPRIARVIQLKTDTADIDKMITPQRIMAGFIDVAFDRSAPSAARNSALKELAAFKKMYPEDNDADKKRSGVLLIPTAVPLDQWAAHAMASQARLKDDVRK